MKTSSWLLSALLAVSSVAVAPRAHADMTMNVEKLSSDGLEVRKLSCSLRDGGLLGSVMVVGSLAKQKKAFDGCAPAGAAFAVSFVWDAGKTKETKVTGSTQAAGDACIVKAMQAVKPSVSGHCSAIILSGDKAKAEAAAKTLADKK